MNSMVGAQGMRGPAGMSAGRNATGYNQMNQMQAPSGFELFNKFTPEQMKLFQSLFKNVGPNSFLSQLAGGDEGSFNQMEEPMMRKFQELMSQNASQFSGMGMGARSGSGFQNFQNQATRDFASDLASKRMQYMRDALHDLMSFSGNLLGQEPYGYQEKPQSFLGSMAPSLGQGFGSALGSGLGGFLTGGPMGALAGAGGSFLSSLFGK